MCVEHLCIETDRAFFREVFADKLIKVFDDIVINAFMVQGFGIGEEAVAEHDKLEYLDREHFVFPGFFSFIFFHQVFEDRLQFTGLIGGEFEVGADGAPEYLFVSDMVFREGILQEKFDIKGEEIAVGIIAPVFTGMHHPFGDDEE